MMRRRMMMQESTKKAKYPFKNGTHTFINGEVTVSEGHKCLVKLTSRKTQIFINLSDIFENTESAIGFENVNNKPEKFLIPSGANCQVKVTNIKRNFQSTAAMNFRKAMSNASLSGFGTGNFTDETDKIVDTIAEGDQSVGCYFFYAIAPADIDVEISFDVEFYVNGERWI